MHVSNNTRIDGISLTLEITQIASLQCCDRLPNPPPRTNGHIFCELIKFQRGERFISAGNIIPVRVYFPGKKLPDLSTWSRACRAYREFGLKSRNFANVSNFNCFFIGAYSAYSKLRRKGRRKSIFPKFRDQQL